MKGIKSSEMKYKKTLEMKHCSFRKYSEMKCAQIIDIKLEESEEIKF